MSKLVNLYMISLGGKVKRANIEVHDVQFVIADNIDNTIDLIKSNWYGFQEKLHMDSYKKIIGADRYRVSLVKEKPDGNKKLFFIHVGGYDKELTQELHRVDFFVAETAQEAKQKALKDVEMFKENGHVDQVVDVEECLLTKDGERYYIALDKSEEYYDLRPDWFGYRRIDK